MAVPDFQNLVPYEYLAGQIDIIQYAVSLGANAVPMFNGYNEAFIYSLTAPNQFGVQFEDSVDITPADFANTSMLARDMKNSLGKTLAVFTSHYVSDVDNSTLYKGVSIDSSVGQFQNNNEFIKVNTFQGLAPAAAPFTIVTITSFLNNLRT